jgi:hypothetical protein
MWKGHRLTGTIKWHFMIMMMIQDSCSDSNSMMVRGLDPECQHWRRTGTTTGAGAMKTNSRRAHAESAAKKSSANKLDTLVFAGTTCPETKKMSTKS